MMIVKFCENPVTLQAISMAQAVAEMEPYHFRGEIERWLIEGVPIMVEGGATYRRYSAMPESSHELLARYGVTAT